MQMWLYGNSPVDVTRVDQPTRDDVQAAFDELNNEDKTGFSLYVGIFGLLQIFGSEQGRFIVTYQQDVRIDGHQSGRLVDPDMPDDDSTIDINVTGEVNPEPLRLTVPRDTALEVALYFLENEAPPRGYIWDGNMDKFM